MEEHHDWRRCPWKTSLYHREVLGLRHYDQAIDRYPIHRGEVGFFFLAGNTLSGFCMYGVCQCLLHSLLFCLNVNDRSSSGFSVLIWQLVHGTTLINAIYQPFRSFLLDEGSVILIAKECIDIKTRTPTLAFYDKEFPVEKKIFSCFLTKALYFPPSEKVSITFPLYPEGKS